MKPKLPPVPKAKNDTVRKEVRNLLTQGELSAKDISMAVGIGEKDVYTHLEHIRQSCRQNKQQFCIRPAICKECGFVFKKRTRLTKPGKCPVCRSNAIEEPLYRLA